MLLVEAADASCFMMVPGEGGCFNWFTSKSIITATDQSPCSGVTELQVLNAAISSSSLFLFFFFFFKPHPDE